MEMLYICVANKIATSHKYLKCGQWELEFKI